MDEKKMAFLPFGGEDENADPQTTVKVKNPELEAAIKVYAKERSVDNLNDLLRAMQQLSPKRVMLAKTLKIFCSNSFKMLIMTLKKHNAE